MIFNSVLFLPQKGAKAASEFQSSTNFDSYIPSGSDLNLHGAPSAMTGEVRNPSFPKTITFPPNPLSKNPVPKRTPYECKLGKRRPASEYPPHPPPEGKCGPRDEKGGKGRRGEYPELEKT